MHEVVAGCCRAWSSGARARPQAAGGVLAIGRARPCHAGPPAAWRCRCGNSSPCGCGSPCTMAAPLWVPLCGPGRQAWRQWRAGEVGGGMGDWEERPGLCGTSAHVGVQGSTVFLLRCAAAPSAALWSPSAAVPPCTAQASTAWRWGRRWHWPGSRAMWRWQWWWSWCSQTQASPPFLCRCSHHLLLLVELCGIAHGTRPAGSLCTACKSLQAPACSLGAGGPHLLHVLVQALRIPLQQPTRAAARCWHGARCAPSAGWTVLGVQ